MANLIFSRNANDSFLDMTDIKHKAPAAYFDTPSEHVSGRYGHISTMDIIKMMDEAGYGVVQAASKKPHDDAKLASTEHMLAFAAYDGVKVSDFSFLDSETNRPEIILYNSHDATSSAKLFVGSYRFICSNGIISGQGFESRIRHSLKNASDFFTITLKDTINMIPDYQENVRRMSGTKLASDDKKVMDFAFNAASLCWDWMDDPYDIDSENTEHKSYAFDSTINDLVRPCRDEDSSPTVWNIFNRAQERLIRGHVQLLSVSDKSPKGKVRKARAINSVKENVRVNRALWDLSQELLLEAC